MLSFTEENYLKAILRYQRRRKNRLLPIAGEASGYYTCVCDRYVEAVGREGDDPL